MKTECIHRFLVILLVGLLGCIMFFPFNFFNGQTCIVDRWLNSNLISVTTVTYEARLHRYVVPYGLLWWGSIGLSALFFNKVFVLRKEPKNGTRSRLHHGN